jgi:hypothetical protein
LAPDDFPHTMYYFADEEDAIDIEQPSLTADEFTRQRTSRKRVAEDEPTPPEKTQKRPQGRRSEERRWACPHAKRDAVTYHRCVGWGCGRIESVERHLRSKHALSPTVEHNVKKLPPFKSPEDRWRAYYSELFGIAREDMHLIPSPHFEDIPTSAVAPRAKKVLCS